MSLMRWSYTERVAILTLTLLAAAAGVWSELVADPARAAAQQQDQLYTTRDVGFEVRFDDFGKPESTAHLASWGARGVAGPGLQGGETVVALFGYDVDWAGAQLTTISALQPVDEQSVEVSEAGFAVIGANFDVERDTWNSLGGSNWSSTTGIGVLNLDVGTATEPQWQSNWSAYDPEPFGTKWVSGSFGMEARGEGVGVLVLRDPLTGEEVEFLPFADTSSASSWVAQGGLRAFATPP